MPIRICRALLAALALSVAATPSLSQPVQLERPASIGSHPDLNGIWQVMNGANHNLEAHSATALDAFWQLGAIAAVPAGPSMLKGGGRIPYLPEALAKREAKRASWPAADPEAMCYMLGIPRSTYQGFPFQIFQDDGGDMLMSYPFAASNRVIHMLEHSEAPIDSWMGRSNGRWEGEVLVIETTGQNGESWFDRAGNHASNQLKVTERFTKLGPNHLWYEATMEDPATFSAPWTIEMPLYRHIESGAQLLEHKCVPFADKLLYQDLLGLDGSSD